MADVNFSKSDIRGEGAVPHSDMTAVKFDDPDEVIVGNEMGDPKENEYCRPDSEASMKILNGPRKRRIRSGRTLRAGQ